MARTIDSLMVVLLLLPLWCCELATKTSAWTIQPQLLFESSFRTKKQNPLFSDSSSSSTTSCPSSFDNNSNTVDNRHNKSTDGFDFTIRQCEYAGACSEKRCLFLFMSACSYTHRSLFAFSPNDVITLQSYRPWRISSWIVFTIPKHLGKNCISWES